MENNRVFKSLFRSQSQTQYYAVRTFTYYIPAPPVRKTGYQEREFDSLTGYILSLGFELLDFQMQSHSNPNQSGLWILCKLGAPTKEIFLKKIDPTSPNLFENNPNSTQEIPLDTTITYET